MKPSGYYWVHPYEHLAKCGKRAITVSPLALNRNRETINVSKDKSDPKDAYNIADLKKVRENPTFPFTGIRKR